VPGVDRAGRRAPRGGGETILRSSDQSRKPVPGTPGVAPEASLAQTDVGYPPGTGKPPASRPTPEPVLGSDAAAFSLAKRELDRILESAAAGRPFALDGLQTAVGGMAKSIASGDALLVHALGDDRETYDLSRHMVNTAVFAIKIGQGGGCRGEELPWLGLAACLHDLGMSTVPAQLLEKPGPLTGDETTLVRRHPETGFRMLQRLGSEFEWLANVALQEHEREDGSGYPRGLKGNEIHAYAKIVGLADAYEALTHFRPYRTKRGAFDAVKELITVQRTKFPDHALKGLIRGLSTFPVGSHVRLNSMEIARIVATNPAFPLRPVIEVISGPRGEPLATPRRVDLSTNTLLYVTEACSSKTPA
jgi:HD-GYP domain-containing protein (c-di-GMP phosphodiesterase class II)